MITPIEATAVREFLAQVKEDTAELATLRPATLIDIATAQATLSFWCDEMSAALRRCDRARRDFCNAQVAHLSALLYFMIDNGAEVVS